MPPGIPGDSGSGYLDAHGAAFGVLSTEFDDAQHSNGVDRPRRRAGLREHATARSARSRSCPGNEPFLSVSL